uniref:Uncharacterized protein n=1 Tax=Eptatretus burgeri TaxID=7764 RepID=A0A8C4Q487_EPTBU
MAIRVLQHPRQCTKVMPINGFPPSEADSQSRSTAVLNRSPRPFTPGGFGSVPRPSIKAVEPYVLTMLTPDAPVASAIPKTNFNRYPAAYPGRSKDINVASESIINKTDLEMPARGPAQRPAILLPVGQSLMNRESETQHAPQPTTPNTENLPPREQRISIPAVHAGTLQEATKRPKQNVYNFSEGVKASQNSEQQKAMQKRGFESCPEEDFLSLGAEACNFLRAEKMRSPPPIAPKPARPGSASDVSPPNHFRRTWRGFICSVS